MESCCVRGRSDRDTCCERQKINDKIPDTFTSDLPAECHVCMIHDTSTDPAPDNTESPPSARIDTGHSHTADKNQEFITPPLPTGCVIVTFGFSHHTHTHTQSASTTAHKTITTHATATNTNTRTLIHTHYTSFKQKNTYKHNAYSK